MTEEIAFSDWTKMVEHSDNDEDDGVENGLTNDGSVSSDGNDEMVASTLSSDTSSSTSTCSWLPVYGFHQSPVLPLPHTILQQKNVEFYANDMVDGAFANNHLLLETIVEEMSDDLCSETSESDYISNGLLTDSVSTVIHISSDERNHSRSTNGRKSSSSSSSSYWNCRNNSVINTDPGVQDDDDNGEDEEIDDFTDDEDEDDDEEDENSNESDEDGLEGDANRIATENGFHSRTNSLLQFENLEKHYENVFRSQRTTSDSFDMSDVMYEGRGVQAWRFRSSSQPENLHNFHEMNDNNDSSSLSSSCTSSCSSTSSSSSSSSTSNSSNVSSDEILSSSYNSNKFDSLGRKLSLRSFRSVDSLTSLHRKQEKEQDFRHSADLSQSLNENMSKLTGDESTNEIPTQPARGIYETMECLSDIPDGATTYRNDVMATVAGKKDDANDGQQSKRRSTENLSEDSGFGDHISKESSSCKTQTDCGTKVKPRKSPVRGNEYLRQVAEEIEETGNDDEDNNDDNKEEDDENNDKGETEFNSQCWQSDPYLLDRTYVVTGNDTYDANKDDLSDEILASKENECTVASASTPNLLVCNSDENECHYQYAIDGRTKNSRMFETFSVDPDNEVAFSTVSMPRIYPLKRVNLQPHESSSTRANNVQIMTSFVNLTDRNEMHVNPVALQSPVDYSPSSNNYIDDCNATPVAVIDESCNRRIGSDDEEKENNHCHRLYDEGDENERYATRSILDKDDSSGADQTARRSNSPLPPATQPLKLKSIDNNRNFDDGAENRNKDQPKSTAGKFGGFFQRFSLRRLSGRKSKCEKRENDMTDALPVVVACVPKTGKMHDGRTDTASQTEIYNRFAGTTISIKPPLPPQATTTTCSRPGSDSGQRDEYSTATATTTTTTTTADALQSCHISPCLQTKSSSMKTCRSSSIGLLETDIDSSTVMLTEAASGNTDGINTYNCHQPSVNTSIKSKSLLNLDNRMSTKQQTIMMEMEERTGSHNCNDNRAKSMEFLLDKENQAAAKAPENELQKGNGERKMSEHELRVQRSLQKLNIPEWYKNSAVPARGFLLKRYSEVGPYDYVADSTKATEAANINDTDTNTETESGILRACARSMAAQRHSHPYRWTAAGVNTATTFQSKTTSLSNLGSGVSTSRTNTATCNGLSNTGPTNYSFSRWSASRLNTGSNSNGTSPSGSARSSFNHKQPYLGWRSQEKLSKPRTPAERLAAGLLPQKNQNGDTSNRQSSRKSPEVPVRTSSLIANNVCKTRDSPATNRLSSEEHPSRLTSSKGITNRLYWLESSFVGVKPPSLSTFESSASSPTTFSVNRIPAKRNAATIENANAIQPCLTVNSKKNLETRTFDSRINGEYLLA